MPLDETYDEITSAEADFLISLYEHIRELILNDEKVTLVRLDF